MHQPASLLQLEELVGRSRRLPFDILRSCAMQTARASVCTSGLPECKRAHCSPFVMHVSLNFPWLHLFFFFFFSLFRVDMIRRGIRESFCQEYNINWSQLLFRGKPLDFLWFCCPVASKNESYLYLKVQKWFDSKIEFSQLASSNPAGPLWRSKSQVAADWLVDT